MTPSQILDSNIDEIRARFREARQKAEHSEKIAPLSVGASYDWGYADALGELLEYLIGDAHSTEETK